MDVAIVLIIIALLLAILALFLEPHQFRLLAASVIIISVALLLPEVGVS